MNLQECIDLATQVRVGYIATDDNSQPRVRALGLWFADATGFYFQVWTVKAIYRQLQQNKKAEVCFYQPGQSGALGKMLRIAGDVEILQDKALKEKVMQDRPFLKNMGLKSADDPRLAIFRIAAGEAYIWTPQFSGRESEIPRISF
jgi:pyridoxamine 5'-phosphate oxidase